MSAEDKAAEKKEETIEIIIEAPFHHAVSTEKVHSVAAFCKFSPAIIHHEYIDKLNRKISPLQIAAEMGSLQVMDCFVEKTPSIDRLIQDMHTTLSFILANMKIHHVPVIKYFLLVITRYQQNQQAYAYDPIALEALQQLVAACDEKAKKFDTQNTPSSALATPSERGFFARFKQRAAHCYRQIAPSHHSSL